MKMKIIAAIFAMLISLAPGASDADTVYFNNGGTIEGIIKGEDDNSLRMDIGFGTITCAKREIVKIERSTQDEIAALTAKWDKKRLELKANEEEFNRERQKRFAEYEEQTRLERERREKEERGEGMVDLARDHESKSALVNVLLNEKVNATLILDTGASIVVLTKRKGEELGLDLNDTAANIAMLQLAGNRKIAAKMVMLKSVRIKDIEVKDVLAGVLMEDGSVGLRDGLLGMTFLSRFNLKIDLKNMKMALEKPE